MKLKISILLALVMPLVATAQSAAYQDADTPGEAVGMMSSTLVIAAKMYQECSRRFPDAANTMKSDWQAWETKERHVIRVTQYHWAAMEAKEAKLVKMKAYLEGVVARNIENLEGAPLQELGGGDALKQYCMGHFADLASGVWRSRTPRQYKFLDEAPEPSK